MVGDYSILKETKAKYGKALPPMSYETAFTSLFSMIGFKLYLFDELGLEKHNIGELKAWLDFLDMIVKLAIRVGYDDSNVSFADHAFYNHREKLESMKKLVKEHYVL